MAAPLVNEGAFGPSFSGTGRTLRYDVLDDIPSLVSETEIAAGIAIGELGEVHSEQVEEGRVQVVHVDFVLDRIVAPRVGGAIDKARLHAAAGQPHRKRVRVVIASVVPLR